ncbi:hypothetical protein [Alteraurantiacibacter aestuarii]|uniref:Uncharacterized protein n=1 Tax=Alteraurantiacibacter aestuarii TaxID=650004 RepID=A0A844ZMI7_9SPHN|nr:hypothetical protein [Alteraurantiacibacter aestuarii]MXO88057.1 hypothetical protein [Alteraurantiacibacter aestuarii]
MVRNRLEAGPDDRDERGESVENEWRGTAAAAPIDRLSAAAAPGAFLITVFTACGP